MLSAVFRFSAKSGRPDKKPSDRCPRPFTIVFQGCNNSPRSGKNGNQVSFLAPLAQAGIKEKEGREIRPKSLS